MNELIKKLAAALGLGEDAGEEQILEALSACIEENKALKEAAEGKKPGDGKQPPEEDTVVANKAVCELLGLKAGAPAAEVAAVIMSLKGKKPDEATMLICKQLGVSAEDLEKYGIKEE